MRILIKKILKEEFDEKDFSWLDDLGEIREPKLTKDLMNLVLWDDTVTVLTGLEKSDVINKKSKDVIFYKKMRYKKSGMIYSMDVSFKKTGNNWVVIGRSGDFGWGDWYYEKKHLMGKRIRLQVFKQILLDFKNVIMRYNEKSN